MRNIKILLSVALVCVSISVAAQPSLKVAEIKSLGSEKWWGLVVDNINYHTPFSETFEIDTRTLSPMRFTANLLLSSKGRYIWSDEEMSIAFNGNTFRITTKDRMAEVERGGRTLRDAYLVSCHKHFPPSGAKVSERLFSSPIYELGGENSLLYTQQEVVDFANFLLSNGVPEGAVLIPVGWQSQSAEVAFDPENYPSPQKMVEYLHSKGMRVMLTVTPYVMASGRGYRKNLRDDRLLTDKNGQPMVFQSRMGYTACMKLSKSEAAALNSSLKKFQADMGIDGYYFDCLDVVPVLEGNTASLVEFFEAWSSVSDGIDAAIYSSPVSMQLSSAVSASSPSRRTDWPVLNETLQTAIDASVLGFSLTSLAADLDFLTGDDRLILRTAQLSAALPVAIVPYAAWSLKNTQPLIEALLWRASIGDYITATVESSALTAEPIIRHLEYEFPNNGFANCSDQFMIGDRWLIAPAVSPSEYRMVRLPRGTWYDAAGKKIRGPKVINVNMANGKMAVYRLEK